MFKKKPTSPIPGQDTSNMLDFPARGKREDPLKPIQPAGWEDDPHDPGPVPEESRPFGGNPADVLSWTCAEFREVVLALCLHRGLDTADALAMVDAYTAELRDTSQPAVCLLLLSQLHDLGLLIERLPTGSVRLHRAAPDGPASPPAAPACIPPPSWSGQGPKPSTARLRLLRRKAQRAARQASRRKAA